MSMISRYTKRDLSVYRWSYALFLAAGLIWMTSFGGIGRAGRGGDKAGSLPLNPSSERVTQVSAGPELVLPILLTGQPLSGSPLIRLDAGMHYGEVQAIAGDPAGQTLYTGSRDGTIRRWERATGQLIQTLRLPALHASPGTTSAMTLSPSLDLAAVALLEPVGEGTSSSVYVLRLSTGDIIQHLPFSGWTAVDRRTQQLILDRKDSVGRVADLLMVGPSEVTRLAFSADGLSLALAYSSNGNAGSLDVRSGVIRVKLAHREVVARFETAHRVSNPPNVNDLVMDSEGRTILSLSDGRLLCLGADFAILGSANLGGLGSPELSLSREGILAVLSQDRTQIELRHCPDLAKVQRLSPSLGSGSTNKPTEKVQNVQAAIEAISWSPDGSRLYSVRGDNLGAAQAWSAEGKALGVWPLDSSHVSVMDVLPDGALALGQREPVGWGIVTPGKPPELVKHSPTMRFSLEKDSLSISPDGLAFVVKTAKEDDAPVSFSLKRRAFGLDSDAQTYVLPQRASSGIRITFEVKPRRVKINLSHFSLAADEEPSSWTTVPSLYGGLVGTNHRLLFASQAPGSVHENKWSVTLPAGARSVNCTSNGTLAVVALEDGTIRWYRLRDGANVLNLALHADGRRYVLWTPSGEFDAAPGAEDIIGWQVSYGPQEKPDFYNISQFHDAYFRPGLGERALRAAEGTNGGFLDNPTAGSVRSRLATQLPPVVTTAPASSTLSPQGTRAEASVLVRSPSGGHITAVRVISGGRPLPAHEVQLRAVQGDSSAPTNSIRCLISFPVPATESDIAILASNEFGWSQPQMLRLRTSSPSAVSRPTVSPAGPPADLSNTWNDGRLEEAFATPPSLYLLAIGISTYKDSHLSLEYAAKDANDFATLMEAQRGKLFRTVNKKMLLDSAASHAAILEGLTWLVQSATSRDVAILFMAGHGSNDSQGRYIFLPYEAERRGSNQHSLKEEELDDALSRISAKTILLLDSCSSGSILQGLAQSEFSGNDSNGLANGLSAPESGVIVLTASTGSEVSYERPELGHGAFTFAVLEGLKGKADVRSSGRVTVTMLDRYISRRVSELTKGKQVPAAAIPSTVRDFPVALTP